MRSSKVQQSYGLWDEPELGGVGPDGVGPDTAVPSVRQQHAELFVARVIGV